MGLPPGWQAHESHSVGRVGFGGSVGDGVSRCQVGDAEVGLHERLEALSVDWGAQLSEDALHEPEMDGAHDVAVLRGGLAERAVMQQDAATVCSGGGLRCEPDLVERVNKPTGGVLGVQLAERRRALGEVSPPRPPGIAPSASRLLRLGADIARQDLGEQPVASSPGTGAAGVRSIEGPGTSRLVALLGGPLYEAGLHQSVEMEPDGVRVEAHAPG